MLKVRKGRIVGKVYWPKGEKPIPLKPVPSLEKRQVESAERAEERFMLEMLAKIGR